MSNTKPIYPPSRVPAGFNEYEGDRQFATTLARGLELLRCFTPGEPVLGNKDLSQRLGLPAADILGELGKGFRYAQVRLAPARLTHCMRWLGQARRAHELAVTYARRRTSGAKASPLLQGLSW